MAFIVFHPGRFAEIGRVKSAPFPTSRRTVVSCFRKSEAEVLAVFYRLPFVGVLVGACIVAKAVCAARWRTSLSRAIGLRWCNRVGSGGPDLHVEFTRPWRCGFVVEAAFHLAISLLVSQVKNMLITSYRRRIPAQGGSVLQEAAIHGNVEMWGAVVDLFKSEGVLEEVGRSSLVASSQRDRG